MAEKRYAKNRKYLLRFFLLLPLAANSLVVNPFNVLQLLHRTSKETDVENQPHHNHRQQRAIQRVFVRKKARKDSIFAVSKNKNMPTTVSTVIQMTGGVTTETIETISERKARAIIIKDFESLGPSDIFHGITHHEGSLSVKNNSTDSIDASKDVIHKDFEITRDNKSRTLDQKSSKFQPIITASERFLIQRLQRWSKQARNLKVDLIPINNMMSSFIRSGNIKCDLKLSFHELFFGPIQFSKSMVEFKNLSLNLLSFPLPQIRRFPKQFDVYFKDLTFSEKDLNESSCIRNGLQRLLNKLLKEKFGISKDNLTLDSIRLLPSGRVSCSFAGNLKLEFRIGFTTRGHVITFNDFVLIINNVRSQPFFPSFDLDVGHTTKFFSIKVEKKKLSLCANVRITPGHTMKLQNYSQSRESYSAKTSFNIGIWLSNLGGFFN